MRATVALNGLKINSSRNKFDSLIEQIRGNLDVLLNSVTKPDSSFLRDQFLINGYNEPYRVNRNCQADVMLYVREDIPSKHLNIETSPSEGLHVEINLRTK